MRGKLCVGGPVRGNGRVTRGTKAGGEDYLLKFLVPRVVTENTQPTRFRPGTVAGVSGRISLTQTAKVNILTARRSIQRSAFAEQLHHRDDHVDDRPGRGENNYGERRHLLLLVHVPLRDGIRASQIGKDSGTAIYLLRRKTKNGRRAIGQNRNEKNSLSAESVAVRGRTSRFHRL